MLFGLLLSLLAHALILSIGFGVSAMRAGGGGPIKVSLAPLPPAAVSDTLPPLTETIPPTAAAAPAPPPNRTPDPGFRLFDPRPMAPPPEPVQAAKPTPARRRRSPSARPPQRKASPTPVIVQQDHPDAAFKVPLAEAQEKPLPEAPQIAEPEPMLAEAEPDARDEKAEALAERRREADEDAQRLASEQEAERVRLAETERVARQREQALRQAE